MSYSGLDVLSGRETMVTITNSYIPYTTGGNPQFRLIITGSFANTAAYYVGDLNATSFGVVFTFKDYIPESPSGTSYAMPPTGCVFVNDTGYTYEDADFILIGSDVNKANLFHINAESAILPRQLIVVSELADAYSIQNGQVVNKNFAVFFFIIKSRFLLICYHIYGYSLPCDNVSFLQHFCKLLFGEFLYIKHLMSRHMTCTSINPYFSF